MVQIRKGVPSAPDFENVIPVLGNLNVGKTSIFEQLCRGKASSFNYPGSSVRLTASQISGTKYTLLDTPGIHSVFTLTEDEAIARDVVLTWSPRTLLLVADASNLSRSLSLFLQFGEYGIPAVLDLNLMDEARQRGISINVEKLSQLLGVPVNGSVAVEGIGLRALRRALPEARVPHAAVRLPETIETFVHAFQKLAGDGPAATRAVALQALTRDTRTLEFLAGTLEPRRLEQAQGLIRSTRESFFHPPEVLLNEIYTQAAHRIVEEVQTVSPPARPPLADQLGVWSRNPITGVPIALFVLLLMYLVVGEFGAQFLVGVIEGGLFGKLLIPAVRSLCLKVPLPLFERAVTGEFGLFSVGMGLALGVVTPVLFTFFFMFGIIEDSGYLPRLSVLMERLFRRVGLTGKGVLPLVMGFSCVTMAIMTTRVLETKKERIIATLLLLLGIPCAPLLSVMLVILTDLNWKAYVVVFGVIALQIYVTGYLADRLIPGERSLFFLEIPPLRLPRPKNILLKTTQRIVHFIAEAIPVFLLATFVLFVLSEVGLLTLMEHVARPFLQGALGLPQESVRVILSTVIRREAGAALLNEYFVQGVFNDVQTVLLLLLSTFLVPCVNALLVTFKEHGVRTGLLVFLIITPYALLLGMVLHFLFGATNVHFR